MTPDDFTEAASAAAEEQWTRDHTPGHPLSGPERMNRRIGFTMGAAWARDRLTTQEPTEDDADAAYTEWKRHTPRYVKPGVIRCACGAPGFWAVSDAHHQHALWHAIRAARRARHEEERPHLGSPTRDCGRGPCSLGDGHHGDCRL